MVDPNGEKGRSIRKKTSKYKNVTKKSKTRNIATNVSRRSFESKLRNEGWRRETSRDGKVVIYKKNGAKYAIRDYGKSFGGPTAEFTPRGMSRFTLKIRLEG